MAVSYYLYYHAHAPEAVDTLPICQSYIELASYIYMATGIHRRCTAACRKLKIIIIIIELLIIMVKVITD